jgi:predicted amidohydrolase
MTQYLAAAVQLNSTDQKSANLETASRLVNRAAQLGASLIVLPELFNCLGEPAEIVRQAESIPGPTSELMSQLAAEHQVTLVAGSIAESVPDTSKVFNTSLLFGPDGQQVARYRKIHLFEINMPGKVSFCESDIVLPGKDIVVSPTECGRIGQATCYDLRFPELFRRLVDEDAEVIVVPSAFTSSTGPDHWEVLLRARGIESQTFVVAPNQFGQHAPQLTSYGRSKIIDPWGTVLATAPDGEGLAIAEIDMDQIARTRDRLPSLKNRRL